MPRQTSRSLIWVRLISCLGLLAVAAVTAGRIGCADNEAATNRSSFPTPYDTQDEVIRLLTPEQARQTLTVPPGFSRSEEHTSELQSRRNLVCRLRLEKKKEKHRSPSPSVT